MELPLQITFRNLDHSDWVEASVRRRVGELERYIDRIVACRVIVEATSRSRHKGKTYHLRIDVTVPGGEIVVKRDPPKRAEREDIRIAIRDAFAAAARRLKDHAGKRRDRKRARDDLAEPESTDET